MKKLLILTYFLITPLITFSQAVTDSTWKKIYRATSTQVNNLIHTKLEVKFDYSKSYLYGKAWLTLKPHFYPTDSLLLDAKGMDIKEVSMILAGKKVPVKYTYDSSELNIRLNKMYAGGEPYTIYIDYTSKPKEVKVRASAAINNAKGLYFINPTGEEKNKHTEIWTQGETEGSSVWMPTIDRPNQKTTQEIYMTVPSKYVTLSNGLLINQKKNPDGTRTDYWKMDLPHAPYLFFMGVGDYAIIKDQYKGKEVSYYVEKEYAPVARKIFGHTTEMMKFFSDKLGVEYVWPKYAQMVARDYVSGAMENTTATLHGEGAYQNARQLVDENAWEGTIAHELFHHWFGDLVTTESWSNLTVNESLADYSQTLWKEYKYGKDAGDDENQQGLDNYILSPADAAKDLVRYRYENREDMFDVVTYLKGGRILHMLRNYVGDAAFFKSLITYLVANKFKSAEATHLRLAFEEVTGQDLNWFWNQWFYDSGHPSLKIDYLYDDAAGLAKVIIAQTQKSGKLFRLPLAIDIYEGKDKTRYKVWVENESDTLTFKYTKRPDLINVDADKVLLAVKDDNKTDANYLHQWTHAPLYLDRREALDYFAEKKSNNLKLGLKDKYAPLRRMTIARLEANNMGKEPETIQEIHTLAQHEKDKLTKAEAIKFLAHAEDIAYESLYKAYLNDSSYSVAGAALEGLILLKPEQGFELAQKFRDDARGDLATVVAIEIMKNGDLSDVEYLTGKYSEMPLSMEKILSTALFAQYLQKVPDLAHVKKGIDPILKFRNSIPEEYRTYIDPAIKTALDMLGTAKGQEVTDYISAGWK